jgi:hypothetical protein
MTAAAVPPVSGVEDATSVRPVIGSGSARSTGTAGLPPHQKTKRGAARSRRPAVDNLIGMRATPMFVICSEQLSCPSHCRICKRHLALKMLNGSHTMPKPFGTPRSVGHLRPTTPTSVRCRIDADAVAAHSVARQCAPAGWAPDVPASMAQRSGAVQSGTVIAYRCLRLVPQLGYPTVQSWPSRSSATSVVIERRTPISPCATVRPGSGNVRVAITRSSSKAVIAGVWSRRVTGSSGDFHSTAARSDRFPRSSRTEMLYDSKMTSLYPWNGVGR